MTIASVLYGGGGLPIGDALRLGSSVTITPANSDVTLLNVTSSNGGLIHGISVNFTSIVSGGGTIVLEDIKLTIDGATERTLSGRHFASTIKDNNGTTVGATFPFVHTFFIMLPIRYASTCVIKIKNTSTTTVAPDARVLYSEF